MQVQLNQNEIEEAIKRYVREMGIPLAIHTLDFTAGRAKGGLTVDIEFEDNLHTFNSSSGNTYAATPASMKKAEAYAEQVMAEQDKEEAPEPAPEKAQEEPTPTNSEKENLPFEPTPEHKAATAGEDDTPEETEPRKKAARLFKK